MSPPHHRGCAPQPPAPLRSHWGGWSWEKSPQIARFQAGSWRQSPGVQRGREDGAEGTGAPWIPDAAGTGTTPAPTTVAGGRQDERNGADFRGFLEDPNDGGQETTSGGSHRLRHPLGRCWGCVTQSVPVPVCCRAAPSPAGGAGLGTAVANQPALTCSDFQHIHQVGLIIEVTPSVSAEGGKGRGRGAPLLAAPELGRKRPPGQGGRQWRGVSACCPITLSLWIFAEPRQPLSPMQRGLSPVPGPTMLTLSSPQHNPAEFSQTAAGVLRPPPTSPQCGDKGRAQGGWVFQAPLAPSQGDSMALPKGLDRTQSPPDQGAGRGGVDLGLPHPSQLCSRDPQAVNTQSGGSMEGTAGAQP